ncbi:MAG: hypothetical protein N2246_01110 [Candidatus Sumerlaeia bacterium]|nr:hypothetical protein [Candidatus Sumerlaeia bacterium]
MKTIIGTLSLLGLIVVILILYTNYSEQLPRILPEKPKRAQVARAMPSPTPVLTRENVFATPVRPAQTKSVVSPMNVSKYNDISAVAKQTKVRIIWYKEEANKATLECEATEHYYLGDFLDELLRRNIIRDFETNNKDFSLYYDQHQQRHYKTKYVLKW